jgi:hypothetical protein
MWKRPQDDIHHPAEPLCPAVDNDQLMSSHVSFVSHATRAFCLKKKAESYKRHDGAVHVGQRNPKLASDLLFWPISRLPKSVVSICGCEMLLETLVMPMRWIIKQHVLLLSYICK